MSDAKTAFTVFTKPWKTMPLAEMGKFLKGLGFDGVELPVRPGYQVEPQNIARLPEVARILGELGLKIGSVTGPTDEKAMAACAEAGVPLIRICVDIPRDKDYLSAISDYQRTWEVLVPALARHGVMLGIQNHADRSIASAAQLRHAIGQFDPRQICAVWDAAHNALQGENVDLALDTIWSHLRLVNLKSAYWKLESGPEAAVVRWAPYWTSGRHGLANWPLVAQELKRRSYRGDICLTAEYTDHAAVDRLIAEDLRFAKSLFAA